MTIALKGQKPEKQMLLPFQGEPVHILVPRAMPWAMCLLALQAAFRAQPVTTLSCACWPYRPLSKLPSRGGEWLREFGGEKLAIVLVAWGQLMMLETGQDVAQLEEEPLSGGVLVGVHVEGC